MIDEAGWLGVTDMGIAIRDLHAERDKYHRELDRLLQILAAQRRLVERQARKSAPALRSETAEAQFVLAAQQRAKRRAQG
jgi:hypothetical protein